MCAQDSAAPQELKSEPEPEPDAEPEPEQSANPLATSGQREEADVEAPLPTEAPRDSGTAPQADEDV